jgi:hypothetical protein
MRLLAIALTLSVSASAMAASPLPASSCGEARALVVKEAQRRLLTQDAKAWAGGEVEVSGTADAVALGSFVGGIELGYSRNEGGSILVCAFDLVDGAKWPSLAHIEQLRTAGESKLRVPFGSAAKHAQRAKLATSGEPNERMIFVWKHPATKVVLRSAKFEHFVKR